VNDSRGLLLDIRNVSYRDDQLNANLEHFIAFGSVPNAANREWAMWSFNDAKKIEEPSLDPPIA
jgi:hypothetical protein